MKVIFLDFDGTINNWDHINGVDPTNVEVLKTIQAKSNAKIIATTSNKYSFQRNISANYQNTFFYEYVKLLQELWVTIDDITPYVELNRCLEILEYLRLHKEVEDFVILDDDYVGDQLKDHQVYLDNYLGLQAEHIVPSLRILSGELGFYPEDYDYSDPLERKSIRINNYHAHNKK